MMARKRIMLFCHDGTGLGHLRRISRIAGALQRRHSCLVVTGAREAAWLVPHECEWLKLPSWDGIDARQAARRDKSPVFDMSRPEALALRTGLIRTAAGLLRPDAVIVDYLPFGKLEELRELVATTPARKYLVHRGTTDTSDEAILRGDATELIANHYDRILVMADRRVSDLALADRYSSRAAAKLLYCGYVLPEPTRSGGRRFDVVCSGGGGAHAEALIGECVRAAHENPDLSFCVVLGPRSTLSAEAFTPSANLTIVGTSTELPDWHASASVVVCTGGYNSMMEAMSGGGRIVVHPNQTGNDDEQITFAASISAHYPVRRLDDLRGLAAVIREEAALCRRHGRAAFPLAADGLSELVRIVEQDLG